MAALPGALGAILTVGRFSVPLFYLSFPSYLVLSLYSFESFLDLFLRFPFAAHMNGAFL
jgi:hypothetical protein